MIPYSRRKDGGFTIIELMIVITIIMILMTIAAGRYRAVGPSRQGGRAAPGFICDAAGDTELHAG